MGDTYKASIYTPEETDKSGFYRFFWGDHYRDVYSREIEAPVLDLSALPGNVHAISEERDINYKVKIDYLAADSNRKQTLVLLPIAFGEGEWF